MTADFYIQAQDYWKSIPYGMLGGFQVLTEPDSRDSLDFIHEFVTGDNPMLANGIACDCGAGIGRVSKSFLLKVFENVDLVEQNEEFLKTAKTEYLSSEAHRVQNMFAVGLQDFSPENNRYDMIWCQWVLSHLTDDDLVAFLERCKLGLRPGGMIGVKENTTKGTKEQFDEEDSSTTRSNTKFKSIFKKANFEIVKEQLQTDFPAGLFPVRMYMLKPK